MLHIFTTGPGGGSSGYTTYRVGFTGTNKNSDKTHMPTRRNAGQVRKQDWNVNDRLSTKKSVSKNSVESKKRASLQEVSKRWQHVRRS